MFKWQSEVFDQLWFQNFMYVSDYFWISICPGDALSSKVNRINFYSFAVNIYAFSRFERSLLVTPLEGAPSFPLPLPQGKTPHWRHVTRGDALSLGLTCSTSRCDVIDCWDLISYLFGVFICIGSVYIWVYVTQCT